MERIAKIIARCQAIDGSQAEIERRAELENDGQFTDEMRTEYATLKSEYDTLIAEKRQIESDAEMRAARAGRAVELQPAAITRLSPANSGAPSPGTNTTPIQHDESVITQATNRFTIPARAKRVGNPRNFKGIVDGRPGDERAYRFGMWALSRIARQIPGYEFPDATNFVRNYMGEASNTAHGGNDGTTGGHALIPEEFSSDMIVLRETYGVARKLFSREQMTSDTKHIPKRASGLTAYFVGESQVGTESNMTWQDIQLVVKDLTILSRMSNQLSADAAISVGDTLAGEMSYAFANKEDECAFNGDGTSTYGGITGVRTLLTNIDGAGTDSLGVVTQGTSNTWSAMVMADFHNVVGKLPRYASLNATWVCHTAFYASVIQKLQAAVGGVTWEQVSNGDRSPRPMFLGYPIEFSQVFPSVTATSGVMVILGDLQLSSVFGDRQQTAIAFSEHATINSESVFERNQIAIRGTERFDINNHGCGTASVLGAVVGLQTA